MDVTLLGTANPCPQLERAGTAIAVEAGPAQTADEDDTTADGDGTTTDGDGTTTDGTHSADGETFLLDCGPMAVRRLVEFGFDPEEIETVFFTHHHMDHNVSFYYFAINSWWFGRRALTVYGPEGTRELVESLRTGFRRHIDSWVHERRPPEGIVDIQTPDSPFDLRVDMGSVQVTALPVEHSLPTYAYRLDDQATGGTFVFSGDTKALESMAEFAVDAEVLVHDVNARDADEPLLDEADIPERYLEPPYDDYYQSRHTDYTRDRMTNIHATPRQAAEVAADAGVDTLVLTHLNPYRNPAAMEANAAEVFDGEVRVAEDGMSFSV